MSEVGKILYTFHWHQGAKKRAGAFSAQQGQDSKTALATLDPLAGPYQNTKMIKSRTGDAMVGTPPTCMIYPSEQT